MENNNLLQLSTTKNQYYSLNFNRQFFAKIPELLPRQAGRLVDMKQLWSDFLTICYSDFNCLGVREGELPEVEIDAILGMESYCGGVMKEQVMTALLDSIENDSSLDRSLFFADEVTAQQVKLSFRHFLQDQLSTSSLKNELEQIFYHTISIREEVEQTEEIWKQYYRPIPFGNDLIVLPDWDYSQIDVRKELEKSYATCVGIIPGLGFGTGTHETTAMCLEQFIEVSKKFTPRRVLDFGCGSGILGISVYALLKSRSKSEIESCSIDFCENDELAISNCVRNLELNEFISTDTFSYNLVKDFFQLPMQANYDFIFANILQETLLEFAVPLSAKLSKEGYLVLSGILKWEQMELVKNTYLKIDGLELANTDVKGDWACLVFKRNN